MKVNLSISHLGWRKDENKEVIKILKKNKIKHIDIVLGRYFNNIEKLDNKKILNLKAFWKNKGFKIYGMQSILYGYEDFNIFKSELDRNKLLGVIKKINMVAKNLGVSFITFGCPKNRFQFKNQSCYYAFLRVIKEQKIYLKRFDKEFDFSSKIYETKVNPLLRFYLVLVDPLQRN